MNYLKFCSIALALLVLGAGSAEAQVCFTQAANLTEVRAEGLTEVVGDVRLVCRPPADADAANPFSGAAVPAKFTVMLEMSSNITNEITDGRVVTVASTVAAGTDGFVDPYVDPGISVTAVAAATGGVFAAPAAGAAANGLGDGKLSSDGTTITWTVFTDDDPATTDETETANAAWDETNGISVVISKVRVNAYNVGDGEDVMANVMVAGRPVNTTPMKVADVTTGLELPVTDKSGDQCMDKTIDDARITVKEGFAGAFMNGDSFVVSFSGVPEGVSITMQDVIPVLDDVTSTSADEEEETFRLELEKTNPRTSGVDKDNMVVLSNAGTGSVRYNIVMTSGDFDDDENTPDTMRDDLMQDGALEWQHITPTFKWKKDAVDLGMVMVSASYHPVSDHAGDTFMTGGAAVPRFMDASEAMTIVTVKDCTRELFYPFVTSSSGYDTGIVVSNTSSAAGSCSATFSGTNAPEESVDLGEIMAGMQSIFLVSSHAEDFSGYLTVNCDAVGVSGFAHVVDTSGLAGSQGYIATSVPQ